MEKLTLKELAPYLPYGLIVQSNRGSIYLMDIYSNMSGSGVEKRAIYSVLDEEMKPILRPLSDLTSGQLIELFEIAYKQVYGHVDELLKNFHMQGWDEDDFGLTVSDEVFVYGFSMDFEGQQDFRFSIRYVDEDNIPTSFLKLNKLDLFQKLFEWKFDIFGLLDKNLAVPVTENFNPYK